MVLSLILLLVGQTRQNTDALLDKPITFSCVGTRAKNLIPELSKVAGVEFEVDKKVGEEVLVINVNDVKLKDLMNRVATCAAAQWTKQGTTYRLERPSELEVKLRKTEAEELEKLLKLQIEKWRSEYVSQSVTTSSEIDEIVRRMAGLANELSHIESEQAWDDYARRLNLCRKSLPPSVTKLLIGVCSELDLKTLTSMAPTSKLVLSTQPNRLQSRLSLPNHLLKQYLSSRESIAQAISRNADPTSLENIKDLFNIDVTEDSQPINKLVLTIEREATSAIYFIEMHVLSATNEVIERTAIQFGGEQYAEPKNKSNDASRIVWSEESQSLIRSFKFQKLSDSARNNLLHPERFDPLSTLPSDLLKSLAKSKKLNLVGSIPDDSVTCFSNDTDITIAQAETMVGSAYHIKVSEGDGWFLATPYRPCDAALARVDREALGRFYRVYTEKGDASLTDQQRFTRSVTRAMEPLTGRYLLLGGSLLKGTGIVSMCNQFDGLRLIDSLTLNQQIALQNGKSLLISELGFPATQCLTSLVYRPNGRMQVRNGDKLCPEATELLPLGLPPSGTLSYDLRINEYLVEYGEDGALNNINIVTLANRIQSNNIPKTMFLARYITHTLKVQYTENLSNSYTLRYLDFDPKRPLTVSQLPANMATELEAVLNRLRSGQLK